MSFLSKIPEPLIAIVTTALEPIAAKVWHALTDRDDPTSIKDVAKHAAEQLAGKALGLAQVVADPDYLKMVASGVVERMSALDPVFHLAAVIDEQSAVRRELEGKVAELEREVADLRSKLTGGVL